MQATYVAANEFTVATNRTTEFVAGRRIKADCGVDGIKYCTVQSSSYSAPNTTVVIKESNLTSNLTAVLYGIVEPGAYGSLPDHAHDDMYYTETEVDTISGSLNDKINAKDSYSSWSFAVDGVTKDAITSGDVLDFVGGDNITITRTADDQITISGSAGGGSTNHSELNELDYASAGHTGFAESSHIHDDRYYTESEVDTISGSLSTEIDGDITTHEAGSSHDSRYYTETELNAGQLDNRYHTQAEITTISGDLSAEIDSDVAAESTILSAEIDSDIVTFSGTIDHNTIVNTHNLTTDIDHNTLANYSVGEHRTIDDGGSAATDLWSAEKITTISGDLSDEIDSDVAAESAVLSAEIDSDIVTFSGTIDHDTIVNNHNLTTDIDHDALTNFAENEHFTEASIDHSAITNLDYASAGHTGFVSTSVLTTTSGDLQTNIDAKDNYQSWSFAVDGVTKDAITSGDIFNIVGGDNITVTRTAEDQITISGSAGEIDHGALTGLEDDDHTQYIPIDGTRGFTATVSGVTPTEDAHLATKNYVDNNPSATYITNETPSGIVNGSNTVFTLLSTPLSGTTTVYLNGLQQKPGGEDYTISGDEITFIEAPIVNDLILCNYFVGTGGAPHGHDDLYYTETEIDAFDFALYSELTTTSGDLQTQLDAKGDMNDVVDDTTPQLGGDLDLNGHSTDYGAILTVNATYEGTIMTVTVDDASAAFGSPLYCEADFHYERADADAESSMPCRALALESGSGSKKVLLRGQICSTAWNWSNGDIYVSTASGTLTQTKPSGDGDVIHIVGRALSADTLFFNPSPEYILYAA